MKLKKKVKKILITLLVIVILVVGGIVVYKLNFDKTEVKEAKILNTIKEYGYTLKDNKSKRYKELFSELENILTKDKVDEEKYVGKISEMFIYDFYSLDDKTAKTDVGGVDFIHPDILENFLQNAENTYYKYVESNIYNNRKQELPTVDEITIENIEETSYEYNDKTAEQAYEVKIKWTYTEEKYADYQNEATLIFVKEGIKEYLVELK